MRPRILVSWSSGKDAAWALHVLRRAGDVEIAEFHTFAHDGPMFSHPVAARPGEVVERDGFVFADLMTTLSSPAER